MQYFSSVNRMKSAVFCLCLSVYLLCLCPHPCNIFSPVSRMKSAVFCLYLSVFFAGVPIHAIFQFSEQDEVCSLLYLSVCLLRLLPHPYNIISPVSRMKSAVFCLCLSVFFACVPIHAIFQSREQDEVCSLLSLSVYLLRLRPHPCNIFSSVNRMKSAVFCLCLSVFFACVPIHTILSVP